ncbi:MAG: tetratricopeptide repeat protein, partial [Planctomycetes bacterium]|nr:tetratricopeptide repeat protein [Planctomycetota bacterium]
MCQHGPVLRAVLLLLSAAVAVSVVSAMAQGPYPPGPPRPGQPGFGQPQRPGQPQMTPFQKQQLEQENRVREKAEQLRQQGKYDEAIRAAQEYVQLKIRRTNRADHQDRQWVARIRSEQQRARMTQQVTGPQGGSPGAATGSSSEEKKLREEADRLSREGQHAKAVKAAEKYLQLKRQRTPRTEAQDQQWLTNLSNKRSDAERRSRENARMLGTTDPAYGNLTSVQANQVKNELEWREKAERRRRVGRYRYAVHAAKKALEWKHQRTNHLDPEDRKWLLDLQNESLHEDRGLSPIDADDMVKMEYRDKWFDYSGEVHDGGEMARAIQAAQETLETKQEQLGDDHPDIVTARKNLKDLQEKRAALVEDLKRYMLRQHQYQVMGDFKDAASYAAHALGVKRKIYGNSDLTVAITAAETGRITQLANMSGAPELFQESLEIILRIYGEGHWRSRDTRVALQDAQRARYLGDEPRRRVYDVRARTIRSAKLLERGWYSRALEIAKEDESFLRTRFPGPSSYRAACLANLAAVYRGIGEYAESVKVQRQALAMLRELYGEEHPEYIHALNNQFAAYVQLGDLASAGETAWAALSLARKIWKPSDREYVVSTGNMGEAYLLTGRLKDARVVLEWVVSQRPEQDNRPDLIRWAAASHHLAEVYARLGRNEAASRGFTVALEARRNVLGGMSQDYLESLTSLAMLNMAEGDYTTAEEQFAAVLKKSETSPRKKRPLYARHLANLAELHQATGAHDKAVVELEESLAIFRDNLDATFGVLSERQQLAMTRGARSVLFAYLWSAAERGGSADD